MPFKSISEARLVMWDIWTVDKSSVVIVATKTVILCKDITMYSLNNPIVIGCNIWGVKLLQFVLCVSPLRFSCNSVSGRYLVTWPSCSENFCLCAVYSAGRSGKFWGKIRALSCQSVNANINQPTRMLSRSLYLLIIRTKKFIECNPNIFQFSIKWFLNIMNIDDGLFLCALLFFLWTQIKLILQSGFFHLIFS